MTDSVPALVELARMYGVMTSYEERPGGPVRRATGDALLGVLAGLGAPVAANSDVPEAILARRSELWSRVTEPVVVAWDGASPKAAVPLRLDPRETSLRFDCTLRLESGETHEWRTGVKPLSPRVVPAGYATATLHIPVALPHGYHRLTVRSRTREASAWVVAAPQRTWEPTQDVRAGSPRDYGLFLPLYALRTSRSWGTGDLTDLAELLRWGGAHGARFVGTLPLTAAYVGGGRAPVDPGPYVPVSRFFWNELYLDVERAPGLERATEAQRLLSSPGFCEEVRRLRAGRRVRYVETMAVKRRVLDALSHALAPAGDPLEGPLAEYAARRGEAVEYARFRAAMERLGAPWRAWSTPRHGQPLERDPSDEGAFRCHLYAQWAMERQMKALADGAGQAGTEGEETLPALYLDLPLGTHAEGFDVWAFRSDFASELSGGAPPDPFQDAGQDWGFPPLHPERTRESGHAYLRRSLAHLMSASGMLRLDHVMSLHRLYCIPSGHVPLDGAYVRYPAEELYAVLCIESHRARCEVVGEDLGTVPEEVREEMDRRRLRRMYVLPFELEVPHVSHDVAPTGDRTQVERNVPYLNPPHPLSVASLETHDLPPFSAFCTGVDVDRRRDQGLVSAEEARRMREERARWFGALKGVVGAGAADTPAEVLPRTLGVLAASPACHVLVNVEDLWGEMESQNAPGTVAETNWTLRARYSLEEWSAVPGLEETLSAVERLRRGHPSDESTTAQGARSRRRPARGRQWPE